MHLIQAWLVDLLRGLEFLHGVLKWIHCDIKPANLLISDSLQLRIADMGGVRFMEKPYSYRAVDEEIYTVTYRAPELLDPECYTYTSSVDMWAVGCVLLDLLFCPSATPIHDRSTSDAVLAVYTTMLQHNRELNRPLFLGGPAFDRPQRHTNMQIPTSTSSSSCKQVPVIFDTRNSQ